MKEDNMVVNRKLVTKEVKLTKETGRIVFQNRGRRLDTTEVVREISMVIIKLTKETGRCNISRKVFLTKEAGRMIF